MKRNVGRPLKQPIGNSSTLTLKISSDLKRKMIENADGWGMTLTEYIQMLVERDL